MQKEFFKHIHRLLAEHRKMVLARIIKRFGSAPRSVGSKCIITEGGNIFGTIGGGLLEHRVSQQAEAVLNQGRSQCYKMRLSETDAAASGMICGGNVEVYLEPLFSDNREAATLYATVNDLVEHGREGVLLTLVENGISASDTQNRILVGPDGVIAGRIRGLKEESINPKAFHLPGLMTFPLVESPIWVDPIRDLPTLYLFGGGHVASCVSPLAAMVGFRVVVIDDRTEFAHEERFPNADEIKVVPFDDAFDRISINDSCYVVIVTRGHLHDRTVLEAALKTEPAYIGMIGSKRKNALIMQYLRERGVLEHRLAQVHAPIGIEINAETPEEIAVSIVAELIQTKAVKNGRIKTRS